jgi:hypothetical protein
VARSSECRQTSCSELQPPIGGSPDGVAFWRYHDVVIHKGIVHDPMRKDGPIPFVEWWQEWARKFPS